VSIASHGLGTKKDKLLYYLRSLSFKGDILNILTLTKQKKMYIFFERNIQFYNILNTKELIFKDYDQEKKEITEMLFYENLKTKAETENYRYSEEEQKMIDEYDKNYISSYQKYVSDIKPMYRWYQIKWKEVLIQLSSFHFELNGLAKCSISSVTGNADHLGKFFIASHIKEYQLCIKENDYESAFNIENGLLLSANMDALFDRHHIAIGSKGKIYQCHHVKKMENIQLKSSLDRFYLTKERKKYLQLHKKVYDTKHKRQEKKHG
jgi:hypothetical protein